MKIIRFEYRGKIEYGVIEGKTVNLIKGSIFDDDIKLTGTSVSADNLNPLAPAIPSKVICVGLNYKDHAKELDMPLPEEPILFLKPPTAVIGPGDEIIYPPQAHRLDYEAELAVVIKRIAKNIPKDRVNSYILGYTCLNDVTARDLQKKDGQWTRAKSFDTFCPIGPYIVTGIDAHDLKIELYLNNEVRQSSSTCNLIFAIEYLVSFISGIMTLYPGDVVATGTPPGVGSLAKGDEVEVRIEGIGTLKNKVV